MEEGGKEPFFETDVDNKLYLILLVCVMIIIEQPPPTVNVDIFLNAQEITQKPTNAAEHITQSFSPKEGAGRIFIGFKTSQTTGLAVSV